MSEFKCPKCGAVVHSEKELKFCICGGKYQSEFEKMVRDAGFGSMADNVFGDL